jgi:hypothetical protein
MSWVRKEEVHCDSCGRTLTSEEVRARVNAAFFAGQVAMLDCIVAARAHLTTWQVKEPTRPIDSFLPQPVLDEDAREKLIERLKRGGL